MPQAVITRHGRHFSQKCEITSFAVALAPSKVDDVGSIMSPSTQTCRSILIAAFLITASVTGRPATAQTTAPTPTTTITRDRSAPHTATLATPRFGAVASVNSIATDAAMDTYRSGGNAIDAAVSCLLMLGVVDGYNSGIGGGCFMVIRLADGRTFALDGREMAPAAATRDMFIRDGKADTKLSQTGPLASGVPGSVAVYDYAVKHFGKKQFADLLLPAAAVAENGYLLDPGYVGRMRSAADAINSFPASKAILSKPDGTGLLQAGDLLVQKDLAKTYRAIAEHGADYFYKGDYAKQVGDWMAANGGILTAQDFANYEVVLREPVTTSYRGHTVIGMPPPSSGGLHVAQILGMIERFDLKVMSDADRYTTIANAMDLAFADRAFWLGDPDFAKVPRGLVDSNYISTQSQRITPTAALVDTQHGTPTKADEDYFKRQELKHTTHASFADAEGNVVAVTATVNTTFGSKVVVPGTGVFLNNQMDDFSVQPGVPNAFKLVGAEANAVGPKKRPLSSMSPTIVLGPDGKPKIIVGAAGGPTIITQVVNVVTNLIDLDLSPEAAMQRGRIHHQWRPSELRIENTATPETRQTLKDRGFSLVEINPGGATNLVVIEGNTLTAVSEPRLPSKAAVE